MYKKNRRRFWYVIAFAVLMAVIALPLSGALPDGVKKYTDKIAINLGLDLQGGLHLEYKLDLARVPDGKEGEAKDAVQAVVERRVNAYGVGEPIVQLAQRAGESFLIVEFPGAEEIQDVKNVIQKTPILEFREEKSEEELAEAEREMDEMLAPMREQTRTQAQEVLDRVKNEESFDDLAREFSQDPNTKEEGGIVDFIKKGFFPEEVESFLFADETVEGTLSEELIETEFGWYIVKKIESRGEGDEREVRLQQMLFAKLSLPANPYKPTDLTGEFLDQAGFEYSGGGMGGGISEPQVSLQFNGEGADLFAEITKRNLGKRVAIFLDDELVSAPTVQSEIVDGRAVISGDFTVPEAKDLAQRLNEGALPVPIELVSEQSVEATLGAEALQKGLKAGAFGLVLTMIYMIFYYRIFGIVAALALGLYAATLVSIFKLSSVTPISITLTLAGIAGLILSIGMAVDANILIFERIREELRLGKNIKRAIDHGFERAWPSIRDGNLSTIITSLILISMGTGFVQGFAIILIIGVLVSMFTAIVLVKIVLKHVAGEWLENRQWLIMRNKK